MFGDSECQILQVTGSWENEFEQRFIITDENAKALIASINEINDAIDSLDESGIDSLIDSVDSDPPAPLPEAADDSYDLRGGCALVVDEASGVMANDVSHVGGDIELRVISGPTSGDLVLEDDESFVLPVRPIGLIAIICLSCLFGLPPLFLAYSRVKRLDFFGKL